METCKYRDKPTAYTSVNWIIRPQVTPLGMGVVIKAEKNRHGFGWPQVAMHSQLPRFLVYNLSSAAGQIISCDGTIEL